MINLAFAPLVHLAPKVAVLLLKQVLELTFRATQIILALLRKLSLLKKQVYEQIFRAKLDNFYKTDFLIFTNHYFFSFVYY